MLINGEYSIVNPDTAKIAYWKDQIFDLNRSLEKTIEKIEIKYPQFLDKFKKGSIITTETIQANLKSDESIVDYVISEKDEFGNRKIFEFVITKNDLFCHSQLIDSFLSSQFSSLKAKLINQFNEKTNMESYNQLNLLLYNAYKELILPIKDHFSGNKLIIIPDEEISYFPFDALLTSWSKKTMINYAELDYLIFDYTISYGYSTNTLWTKYIEKQDNSKVIGFAPDYSEGVTANGIMFNKLKTNTNEIENILTIFDGEIFKGDEASIVQFKSHLNHGSILHLAMHAEVNNNHEGSSRLLFTPNQINNYRLYNYEIGQMSINSPMVVLSACNTGNGKIYSGEGAMSIARNFVLAGVPSVIETLWPVEDLSGSKIMISYYRHLSEGKEKNTALRLAKLDYILTTSPSFVNPRFWAAYTLLGDTSPLKQVWWKEKTILICAIIILFLLVLIITYYRWRSLSIKRALFL
jgi:CHAT domain-containing protein